MLFARAAAVVEEGRLDVALARQRQAARRLDVADDEGNLGIESG